LFALSFLLHSPVPLVVPHHALNCTAHEDFYILLQKIKVRLERAW